MIQADTALNLLWTLISVIALTFYLRAECGRTSTRRERVGRALALFLALVSLFPCVSASDDSVRLQYFDLMQGRPGQASGNTHEKSPSNNLATLVRLLETLESVQIVLIWTLIVFLCFFALVLVERYSDYSRRAPSRSGRAPPAALCLA